MAKEENDTNRPGRNRVYSDEDILDHIQECAGRNSGECTTELLQAEDDLVSPPSQSNGLGYGATQKQRRGSTLIFKKRTIVHVSSLTKIILS